MPSSRRARPPASFVPNLNNELLTDLLFGPIIFRLFNGMPPLEARELAELSTMALLAAAPT